MSFEPSGMHGSCGHFNGGDLTAILVHLDLQDWAILLLTIVLVWTAEFINTALEAVVDWPAQSNTH